MLRAVVVLVVTHFAVSAVALDRSAMVNQILVSLGANGSCPANLSGPVGQSIAQLVQMDSASQAEVSCDALELALAHIESLAAVNTDPRLDCFYRLYAQQLRLIIEDRCEPGLPGGIDFRPRTGRLLFPNETYEPSAPVTAPPPRPVTTPEPELPGLSIDRRPRTGQLVVDPMLP